MLKQTFVGLVLLISGTAFAEPEIKGTAPELAQFINGIPKTAAVTGEAEVRVPAHGAVLSLKVTTENKSLREALRLNLEIRGKLAEQLKKQGIPDDRIQASKFSSTPKFGIFSDKAKSYRVENMMRITVQDEKEFQAAAGTVDQWAEAQYVGVEFEYADRESLKAKAVSEACDKANDRRKIYEEKFGVKLTPVKFDEGQVMEVNRMPRDYALNASRPAEDAAQPYASSFGKSEGAVSTFGELVYTAQVTVEFAVQPK